jgi:hypothetical protein
MQDFYRSLPSLPQQKMAELTLLEAHSKPRLGFEEELEELKMQEQGNGYLRASQKPAWNLQ